MDQSGVLLSLRPTRVAVFRALQLGDVLCAVPALRALRRGLPGASITLIGLPWTTALLPRLAAWVDEVLPFPGYPGLPEREPSLAELPGFLRAAQARRFDLAIQLHGAGTVTNPVVASLGATRLAGFYRPGEFCPDPATFLPYPDRGHEIHRLLQLLERLGIPADGDHLDFPLLPADHDTLAAVPALASLSGRAYACVHPGARSRSKCWPAERFALVADFLRAAGLEVVLTGAGREADLTEAVQRAMHGPAVDAARQDLALGPLAALLAGARLLVANDTGVSHLATALGVPSVIVFSASAPERWAPLDGARHKTLHAAGGVGVPEVLAAVAASLRLPPPAPAARGASWRATGAAASSRPVSTSRSCQPPSTAASAPARTGKGYTMPSTHRLPGASSPSLTGSLMIDVAPGELLDKISILEIKQARLGDPAKLTNVRRELDDLRGVAERGIAASEEIRALSAALRTVNEALWEIEDEIRLCERRQDFGPRFIALARAVYHENDRRAALKRQISELLQSRLIEEKSYTEYVKRNA